MNAEEIDATRRLIEKVADTPLMLAGRALCDEVERLQTELTRVPDVYQVSIDARDKIANDLRRERDEARAELAAAREALLNLADTVEAARVADTHPPQKDAT